MQDEEMVSPSVFAVYGTNKDGVAYIAYLDASLFTGKPELLLSDSSLFPITVSAKKFAPGSAFSMSQPTRFLLSYVGRRPVWSDRADCTYLAATVKSNQEIPALLYGRVR